MSERFSWVNPLVDQLQKLVNKDRPDRATLAHLRRGLNGSPDFTLARVGWLFRGIENEREMNAAILAAGLFAWAKGECPQNGGASFGRAFGYGLSADEKRQREKRFADLLDTDGAELPTKLRQAVSLIARDRVGLDWGMLMKNLVRWDHPDRVVQRRWAEGFWAQPRAEERADEAVATTE